MAIIEDHLDKKKHGHRMAPVKGVIGMYAICGDWDL